jgi:SMC interacting uncharacterized protein involved in chromosome segregation
MGRAIDMEKDIDKLKIEVEKLNNIVRGMASELTEVTDALFEEEETETKEEKKDGKEKANSKGNGKGNKSSDTADGDSDTKSK